ncbi:YgfZ/GcvT domain-containing protein [Terriglobus saanensis]|uniref:Folate-binding protein YgfZ n=1 Tax=Terriglobus saanensis (strain ATCC BAA-1853 / DSM 23119 / SP1PR4) TaxID=401053 RepID=E8V5K8_TERSS|nr:folate-binding protein YgfZ [Terriglobus saanensis]ADV81542.1 folate-binding protein YgfZ [Terriglobus saanensis SP1PR4]
MTQPLSDSLRALTTSAAFVSVGSGWIRVTGSDRVRWLNGMTTNSVQALAPGQGAYTFFLNAQGRIQGDAVIWAEADHLLLQTSPAQTEKLIALLDRFIIMDDVELADVSADQHVLQILGVRAEDFLNSAGLTPPPTELTRISHTDAQIARLPGAVVPRFEIISSSPTALDAISGQFLEEGLSPLADGALEMLRVLEGTPLFGTDIRDRDLPQETAQTRALHFNKGCYLGQEIVERIRSRGNVHRTFHAFLLSGDIPAPGTPLTAEEKPVGEFTSIATLPGGRTLALGYIRREALDRNLALTFPGGTAQPVASPIQIDASDIE